MKSLLKECSLEDQEVLREVCSGVDRSYIANRLPSPYTIDDAIWWINRADEHDGKDGIFRLITVNDKIVGNISIEQKSDVFGKDAEIGYLLSSEYCSKGIATEAVRQICKIAFSELDIIRITGLVYEPNVASRRVLEKNDFVLEGVMKNAVVKNNNVYNLCVLGCSKKWTKKFNINSRTKQSGERYHKFSCYTISLNLERNALINVNTLLCATYFRGEV